MYEMHKPKIANHGLFAEHDMPCAVCWGKPAVLDLQAGIFLPCWECQEKGYQLTKKRKNKKWNLYRKAQ